MKLTILGGGGFRVPLVYKALIADEAPGRVTELRLYDTDETRLGAIRAVLDELAAEAQDPPKLISTTDLGEALAGTDFIFSVLCEELGFVGAVAVIGLLVALVWQGWKVFNRCGDPVGRLLALGITLTIGVQAVINVAVVTVSVPTKGIALPLVSAGGSGAVFLAIMVGILANIPRLRVSERS